MGSGHCSRSLFTQINHNKIYMQRPRKDTFRILATARIHNACTHPMRNFGSELGAACWLAQLLESREEPASNDQWGFDGLLSLSVMSALTGVWG